MPEQVRQKSAELEGKLKAIHAKNIMTRTVITTTPTTPLADTAIQMIKHRISGMPVIGKKGNIVGIVTTTDLFIVLAMIMEGNTDKFGVSPTSPPVDVAMSTDVFVVNENAGLDEIVKLMRNESIHTIPVMNGDKLVGVIGRHDVLRRSYEVAKTCKL